MGNKVQDSKIGRLMERASKLHFRVTEKHTGGDWRTVVVETEGLADLIITIGPKGGLTMTRITLGGVDTSRGQTAARRLAFYLG